MTTSPLRRQMSHLTEQLDNMEQPHEQRGFHGELEENHYIRSWKIEKNHENVGFKISGDIPPTKLPTKKDLRKYGKSALKPNLQKKPTLSTANAGVSASNLIKVIDTADRPADTYAEDTYARAGTYATASTDKPMERIPKAGAFAEAGVGRAGAKFSVFEAEAKGPNAFAGAEASAVGAGAMARAEIGSVSVGAGPLTAKLGLGVDTGASIGVDGVEIKFLGTGFRIGPRPSFSIFGSEVSCVIQ